MFTENETTVKIFDNVTCSDQFYFDKATQLCKPECGVWSLHSDATAEAIGISRAFIDVLGITICIVVLLVSFYQRKEM